MHGVTDTHGDTPEHDRNPGCDLDPRVSEPLHLGRADRGAGDPRESFVELLDDYPNVLAYVAGHTHENDVHGVPARPHGGGLVGDQHLRDRRLATAPADRGDGQPRRHALDLRHACSTPPRRRRARRPARQPPSTPASSPRSAATFAYNDPQGGPARGEGAADDQNVELLVLDPRRRGYARPKPRRLYRPARARLRACICGTAPTARRWPPSCNPPAQTSDYLTVGAPDANGPAGPDGQSSSEGVGENPIDPGNGDQADVEFPASLTDVLNQGA